MWGTPTRTPQALNAQTRCNFPCGLPPGENHTEIFKGTRGVLCDHSHGGKASIYEPVLDVRLIVMPLTLQSHNSCGGNGNVRPKQGRALACFDVVLFDVHNGRDGLEGSKHFEGHPWCILAELGRILSAVKVGQQPRKPAFSGPLPDKPAALKPHWSLDLGRALSPCALCPFVLHF
jgi:hypothetical protein